MRKWREGEREREFGKEVYTISNFTIDIRFCDRTEEIGVVA